MKGFSGIINGAGRPGLISSYGCYNSKFPLDKLEHRDEEYHILLDGVLLNRAELLEEHSCGDLYGLLVTLWENRGESMLRLMKGSFVLCLWDRKRGKVLLSTDRLNKRPLYYFRQGNSLYYSSRFFDLCALLAEEGFRPEPSSAAYAMLCNQGQLYDHFTLLRGVYCLRPYEYILWEGEKPRLLGKPDPVKESDLAEDELIEEFDRRFTKAVRLQYDKNAENGYWQTASVSGGMDTRSTVLTGNRLGYSLDMSYCYCQSGGHDEQVARKLARKLGAPFFFYPLDGGEFLLRPEEHARRNEGQISYAGATGALTALEHLPTEKLGIIHTGCFGGELMGAIFRADDPVPPRSRYSGTAAEEFAECLPDCPSESRMNSNLLLRGCLNFTRMAEPEAEALSPFMDEDVYEFAMTIPFKYRKARQLYVHWMQKFIPNDLYTTYFKCSMSRPFFVQYVNMQLHLRLPGLFPERGGMNPFRKWYEENGKLRDGLEELIEQYSREPLPESIRETVDGLCRSGEAVKVILGLNALTAARLTEESLHG